MSRRIASRVVLHRDQAELMRSSSMDASLMRLSLDDMDQVAVIHRRSFDERLPWLAGLHAPDEDRTYFRDRVFTRCEVWGATRQASLVGFVAFRKCWIDHLYVLPGQQRRGVGGSLLQFAQAASASLLLWTFQQNAPARRFYEHHRFVVVKQTDGSDNDEREADVLYRWDRV